MAKSKPDLPPAAALLHRWAQEAGGQAAIPDFDPDFSASFPNLWIMLTWRQVADVEKEPGSLSIRADGTGWRVQYFDPSAKRSCAVVATTVMDALKRLDRAVVDPETVWTGGRKKRGFRRLEG